MPIVLHASSAAPQEYVSKWEPPDTNNAFEMSAFKLDGSSATARSPT